MMELGEIRKPGRLANVQLLKLTNLHSASQGRRVAMIQDDAGAPQLVYSDGSHWRRAIGHKMLDEYGAVSGKNRTEDLRKYC